MGGCIAQEIAIEYPLRVNRLILASTCATLSLKNKHIFIKLLGILEGGKNYELFIREFFSLIFTSGYLVRKEDIDAAVRNALDYPYPVTAQGFRQQLEALSGFSSQDRLSRIKAETLIMAGREDMLVTAEVVKVLSDSLPFTKTLHPENAAHSFQVEQPDYFINSAVEFLSPR